MRLFSLPELKLKKLWIRTRDMTLVPEDMTIQVEHVAFNSPVRSSTNTPSISFAHLEKFVVSNPVLSGLRAKLVELQY